MGVLKAKTSVFEFSLEQMRHLIAADLDCPLSDIAVDFVIEEVGGDPMDRHPGTKQVTKVRVTQKHPI